MPRKTWKNMNQRRFLELKCVSSERYEPYLVIPMSSATPLYEEKFVGWVLPKLNLDSYLKLLVAILRFYSCSWPSFALLRSFRYGKNKIQHTMHLRAKGFRFKVLSMAFVTHYPHLASDSRIIWSISATPSKPSSQEKQKGDDSKEEETRFAKWKTPDKWNNPRTANEFRNGRKLLQQRSPPRTMRGLMDDLFSDFRHWLVQKYGLQVDNLDRVVSPTVPYCDAVSS